MFELNENAFIKVYKHIQGRTAIIIDDFYKNPDEIRELALSLKYGVAPGLVSGFPGMRCSLQTLELKEKLYNLYLDLCRSCGPLREDDFERNWDNQGFMVNCTNDSFIKKSPLANVPHQDYWEGDDELISPYQFGSVIYLNTPDECAGGTTLYSWKGEMSIPLDRKPEWKQNMSETYDIIGPVVTSMSDDYKFKLTKDKIDKQYTVEFEANMVYNRMVLYQADVLHKANIDLGMFTDYNRINQVFFM
jgi:hypothetical protein